MIPTIIYIPAILGIIIIGLVILYQRTARDTLYFSLMTFFMSVWLLLQYIAQLISGSPHVITYVHASSAVSNFMPLFFFFFVKKVTNSTIHKLTAIFLSVLALTLFAANFLGIMITRASSDSVGITIEKAGVLYFVQIFFSFGLYLYGLIKLVIYGKKLNPEERKKYRLLAISVSQALFVTVLASAVFPESSVMQISLVQSFFIMVLLIGYAIIKHRLFDVRLVVARALGYVLSVVAVGALYSSVAFFALNRLVFNSKSVSLLEEIVYTFLALFLAFTFQPIKGFFDTITKRIFYRDAYDSQQTLAEVSNVIVGNINPHKLQSGTLSALSDALRPVYAAFLLRGSGLTKGRLIKGENVGQQWVMHNPQELSRGLGGIGKRIVVYDELTSAKTKLKNIFRTEDISLVAPLVTKEETIGYLVLGAKKAGNIYTSQDTAMLRLATNELAVALQNAQRFEEIQAFNITLQEKITEATRELKQTNKKLVALDEAKDEFISMASHQLRTPLTSIKGYLSMLSDGDMGKMNAQQVKAVQEAFASSQRMVFLIADFLNVSRIKTGKFVIERSKIDLATMVTEELAQLRELFEAKDLKLSYEPPYDLPTFMLDDNKMRQVMMNMIDNAIYYTPAGGSVNVQLYKTAEELIFKVVDTGIGVAKAEQHKLFTKFFRASNARKARPDGTGLGLFMAQKIIVEQGGAVIFESTEGKGSTFGFRFPLKRIKS